LLVDAMTFVLPSIHDVMPDTLDRVAAIIGRLPEDCRLALTLLVVPGLAWQPGQLDRLQAWQASGIRLAGHGWTHQCRSIQTPYHRLHSLLLSRRAAEHLSETSGYLQELLHNCHAWFESHGFASPDYYVPPAWAMGKLSNQHLGAAPFRYYENTLGIYDSNTGREIHLPLCGFEADTVLRKHFLVIWNTLNDSLSSARRPMRLGIHPGDFELLLGRELDEFLRLPHQYLGYKRLAELA
jgi:predicted deacetylase